MKRTLSSFIMLYSEAIWIYYAIALFSENPWMMGSLSNLLGWLAAGITGYTLHAVLAGRVHFGISLSGSLLVLSYLLYQNWKAVASNGGWGFPLAVSLAVSFLFIRGAGFVYRQPTRLNLLGRFEGNTFFYLAFLLIFSAKQWLDESFHLLFLIAIFISLMGMILTLHSHGNPGEQEETEIRIVGRSGWFAGVLVLLTAGIVLLSFLLLLPSIRKGLYVLALNVWDGLLSLLSSFGRLLIWLFRLLPAPEQSDAKLPPLHPANLSLENRIPEETMPTLPLPWVVGGLTVVGIAVCIILIAIFLKHYQPPKPMKVSRVSVSQASWLAVFRKRIAAWILSLRRKWKLRFPRFYRLEIYWIFRQVEAWGKKNGVPRSKSDTSKEYVEKVIRRLLERNDFFDDSQQNRSISDLLRQLNDDYQAAYYGQKADVSAAEYHLLLQRLKKLRIIHRK